MGSLERVVTLELAKNSLLADKVGGRPEYSTTLEKCEKLGQKQHASARREEVSSDVLLLSNLSHSTVHSLFGEPNSST